MTPEIKFEPFETTADVGLRVYGKNPVELFENASKGMFSLIFEPFQLQNFVIKNIEIEGDNPEDIIVSLLSELIYLLETQNFVLSNLKGREINPKKYTFTLEGESYNKEKHSFLMQIKAVTFHNLKIKKEKDNKLTVDIVFDV